MKFKFGL
jgi:hypothetical protein